MRSGGGVSTATNNTPKEQDDKKDKKCKGATTIPIFLKSKSNAYKQRDKKGSVLFTYSPYPPFLSFS
jgi:hypothetical protein